MHNPNYIRKSVDQQIFDKVVKHLYTQNAQAKDKQYGSCKYREEETGLTCAVGCLISKQNYDARIEGSCGSSEDVIHTVKRSIRRAVSLRTPELLDALQTVHDDYFEDSTGFRDKTVYNQLLEVSVKFNLNTTKLDRVYKDVIAA